MKSINFIWILLVFAFVTSCTSAQKTLETTKRVTQKVETRNYTLIAKEANPLRMNQIHLTSEYDLKILNDSAFAFLPYFGIAHVAPFNTTEGGIKFKEPLVDYKVSPTKKNDGWDISFKVKAETTRYDIFMTIYKNGSTMFTISSFDKDAITFYGEVKE